MDDVLRRFVADAERETSVIGVVLIGSHAIGTPDGESDYDLVVVRRDGVKSHSKEGGLDVLQTTLDGIRNPPEWVRPALAHSRVLLDRTGEVTAAVAAHADVPSDELAELLDSYLNSLYRSLKAWRRGNELAGRLEGVDSLRWLAQFLFALEGKRAPYSNAYAGRLGEFEDEIVEVARTADPKAQQALQARVEELARARGLAHVYDGWTGEIERVMAFRFD